MNWIRRVALMPKRKVVHMPEGSWRAGRLRLYRHRLPYYCEIVGEMDMRDVMVM